MNSVAAAIRGTAGRDVRQCRRREMYEEHGVRRHARIAGRAAVRLRPGRARCTRGVHARRRATARALCRHQQLPRPAPPRLRCRRGAVGAHTRDRGIRSADDASRRSCDAAGDPRHARAHPQTSAPGDTVVFNSRTRDGGARSRRRRARGEGSGALPDRFHRRHL
jgi:hypothetical protein